MARTDQFTMTPSVLDRLIDFAPELTTEPDWASSQGVNELREAVKRDLETLLNTRQTRPELMNSPDELATSVLTYGLPDFESGVVGGVEEQAEVLREAVERAIQRFEPRLIQIQVMRMPAANQYERSLHLVIDAMLRIDPEPVPVTFDTILQPNLGTCQVEAK